MMNRLSPFSIALVALLFVGLAAGSAAAQVIPAGSDFFRTPADGNTSFTFPDGDVESLCGAPPSTTWNHAVTLAGVAGSVYDSVVDRLKDAVFDSTGHASVPIQVQSLAFISTGPQATPCGALNWKVSQTGPQPITQMDLTLTSPSGGTFTANLSVKVEFDATDAASGKFIGSLFYSFDLPDPKNGTPWSFGPNGVFRPAMDTANNCIEVLRAKISTLPARHAYFISDLIAQGRCTEK
jgi:hypothetical protein